MMDIPCLCINLNHRIDRFTTVVTELRKLGYVFGENAHRFSAISLPNNPAAGCSMSHLKCLQIAKDKGWTRVFICEDDIQFLNHHLLLRQWNRFQCAVSAEKKRWDVVLLGGNNMMPFEIPTSPNLKKCCIRIHECLTTTGYIVHEHYYDILMENIRKGLHLLLRDKSNMAHCIDRNWFSLQERDFWYLIIPLSVVQRESYSDVECKVTNFQTHMLNYNKQYTHLKNNHQDIAAAAGAEGTVLEEEEEEEEEA